MVGCPKSINEKIINVDWSNLETAYGSAENRIPNSLRDLYCSDYEIAIKASGFLWGSLCHNNAFISSASLPSYEIIINRLKEKCNEKLKLELLDLIFRFVCCTNKETKDKEYQHLLNQMKLKIKEDKSYFQEVTMQKHKNSYINIFAEEILEQLRY